MRNTRKCPVCGAEVLKILWNSHTCGLLRCPICDQRIELFCRVSETRCIRCHTPLVKVDEGA